ncbi:MAG: hypothetical protein ACRD3V_21765 [Vicinamibacteria bacterium]
MNASDTYQKACARCRRTDAPPLVALPLLPAPLPPILEEASEPTHLIDSTEVRRPSENGEEDRNPMRRLLDRLFDSDGG